MSDPADTRKLDTCGCCEVGVPEHTHYNRPGQTALTYRIGTYSTFLRRMLARLPTQTVADGPNEGERPLSLLSTRASDDWSIAFLDACAIALDVITFYEERVISEGYLLTAVERRSILQLARQIGYELNPGVAASTYLAFTVEDAEGSPGKAKVPQGSRVQSIPPQDKLPQTFETVEEIQARAEWNAMKPQLTESQEIERGLSELFLKGVVTQLQPGDAILLVGDDREVNSGSERWDFRILQTVKTFPETGKDYTRVTWQEVLGHEKPTAEPADNPKVFVFRQLAALFGHSAPDWDGLPWNIKGVYRTGVTEVSTTWGTDWPTDHFKNREVTKRLIDLDMSYPKIIENSWVVLRTRAYTELYKAERVSFPSRADFTLSGKTTSITLDTKENLSKFRLRDTVVFAQSEQLELADRPVTGPVYGSKLVLDNAVPAPEKEQTVMVSGKLIRRLKVADRTQVVKVGASEEVRPADPLEFVPSAPSAGAGTNPLKAGDLLDVLAPPSADHSGRWRLEDADGRVGFVAAEPGDLIPEPADEDEETICEVASIKDYDDEGKTITLTDPLQNVYDRSTLSINANVARGTHGEAVREVPGTGDGAQPHQRFTLKRPPLTYVSASTPSGGKSTVQVRVNGILWEEVPSLYGLDPDSQSYIVRINDEGAATLTFGSARLPTGAKMDVKYRTGTGLDGEVDARSLTTLQTRPLGIKEVTNPLKATGAEDREKRDQARENAALTALTLDRIVSLKDFEDFARAFAGIGKAQAVALWAGETRLVHITVAAASGAEVERKSDLYRGLVEAIDRARDPTQPVRVDSFQRLPFFITVNILVDPRYQFADVRTKVEASLKAAFAFEKRAIGEAVTAAEIFTVIQKLPGIVASDIDKLYSGHEPGNNAVLQAGVAHWDQGKFHGGELLVLQPSRLVVEEMTS